MAAHSFDGALNMHPNETSTVRFPVTGGSAIPPGVAGWDAMPLPSNSLFKGLDEILHSLLQCSLFMVLNYLGHLLVHCVCKMY